jgi:RNA polymerase sigma factor (sigma-70 family)
MLGRKIKDPDTGKPTVLLSNGKKYTGLIEPLDPKHSWRLGEEGRAARQQQENPPGLFDAPPPPIESVPSESGMGVAHARAFEPGELPPGVSEEDAAAAEALEHADTVGRARGGDTAAVSELAARFHQPLVRRLERQFRDPELAQDVAQQVWLRLTEKAAAGELPPIDNPRAFLWTAAQNAARDQLRRSGVRRHERTLGAPGGGESESDPFAEAPGREQDPSRRLEREQAEQALHAEIAKLKPREQSAVREMLKGGGNPDLAGVAERVGLTRGQVAGIWRRVQPKLAASLQQFKRLRGLYLKRWAALDEECAAWELVTKSAGAAHAAADPLGAFLATVG